MRRVALLALCLAAATAPTAAATEVCDAANLLAGKRPLAASVNPAPAPVAFAGVATDGRLAPEGAPWDSPAALLLSPTQAQLIWDLGFATEVRALVLQADGNDRFELSSSLDGSSFEPLGQIGASPDLSGLRSRPLSVATRRLRFLRLEVFSTDGLSSISELQAYCAVPSPWPPSLPVAASFGPSRWRWDDTTSRWWQLGLALAGLALLLSRPPWLDRALAVAGLLAALTYFNFGAFHFSGYIHGWDVFHYYLGAKYFPELGYERLYDCVAVADSLEPGLKSRVEARKITNLVTNELESTAAILRRPERCTAHFSATRWQAFRHDVAWFRGREAPSRWADFSADHGYNATPVWALVGHRLANSGPASDRQILLLTVIDPLYFIALLGVAVWAFGWRGTAVALLVFATFFPCRFFWTGGSLLRWDWLFYTVAAAACARKNRPLLAGLALGYAATLRLFPAVLAVGPLLVLLAAAGPALSQARRQGWKVAMRRLLVAEPTRGALRLLAGAALAVALLVGASLTLGGGPGAYRAFFANSGKHAATPLSNNMGLRMLLTYRPSEVGRRLVLLAPDEPWRLWKEVRSRAWKTVRPLAGLLALGFGVLLARALRRHPEPWVALALGSLAIPFAADLTSYYYAFILVPALLWTLRPAVGVWLLGLGAFTTFLSLAPLSFISTWRDEQYTLISLATVLTFVAIAGAFAAPTTLLEATANNTAAEGLPPRP